MTVLDASAVLAVIQNEPGRDMVISVANGSLVSTVNQVEILEVVARNGGDKAHVFGILGRMGIVWAEFTSAHAQHAADLIFQFRTKGLSLADCACLALGGTTQGPIFTADKDWATLGLKLDIRLIR